jgi:hypothetical protein
MEAARTADRTDDERRETVGKARHVAGGVVPARKADAGHAKAVYTGDYGMQNVRQITRQADQKDGTTQFSVVRRKGKTKPAPSKELSAKGAEYLTGVYRQVAKYDDYLVEAWLIEFARGMYKDGKTPANAARSAAAELDIEVDGVEFDYGPPDRNDDFDDDFDGVW